MTTTPKRLAVREATEHDRVRLEEMVRAFLAATPYGDRVVDTDEHVSELVTLGLTAGCIFVATDGGRLVGMIAVMAYAHPLMGRRIATELMWWVDEESRSGGAGIALLAAAEAWARTKGAEAIECADHGRRALGRLYRRLGFTTREVIYEKDLRR